MSEPANAVEHWDAAYRTKGDAKVSWYAPGAAPVLDLFDRLAVPISARVVDIGGGASRLVDGLQDRGHRDLTVLDLSEIALATARARLGPRAEQVDWVSGDLRSWRPVRPFEVWHDRAVLHFMVSEPDRSAYLETLRAATHPGSLVILATFALDGPDQCSGLPVMRYDAPDLGRFVGPDFEPIQADREEHVTPWKSTQAFTRATFRRR